MKVEKLKNGKYKLSNGMFEVETYDEVIVKNNILYKEIDSELIKKIEKENEYYDDYFKIVKSISKRLRSESEVRKMLINSDKKEEVIEKLKDENLINDKRFAEAFILDKINFSKSGINKIKSELLDHEIDEDLIDDLLQNTDSTVFSEQLKKIIQKKINTNSKKSKQALKEKLVYELISQGYDRDEILNYFDELYEEDSSIYEKEYLKLKEKLSKKYKDKELEYKIREKMYQKGFKNNN